MSLCWWQERGECVWGWLLLPILNSATVPDNMIWQCSSEEQPIKYGKAILFFNDFKLLYITRVSQEWRVLLQWLKKSEFLTPPPRTPNLPVSLKMAAGTRVSRASFHRAGMPFFDKCTNSSHMRAATVYLECQQQSSSQAGVTLHCDQLPWVSFAVKASWLARKGTLSRDF